MSNPCEAVGDRQDDDWDLKPREHRERLKVDAPDLANLLDQGMPKAIANGYRPLDAEAKTARDDYKKSLRFAVWFAVTAAGCAAVAGIYGGLVKDKAALDLLIIRFLVFSQIILLLLSANAIRTTDAKDKFKKWRESRAEAEHSRVTFFLAVMKDASEQPLAGRKLLQHALCYVRRHLYQSQVKYFEDSAIKHERAADFRLWLRQILTALILLSMIGAVLFFIVSVPAVLEGNSKQSWLDFFKQDVGVEAMLAGLGVVAAAFVAAGQADELIDQDEENARRYRETKEKLTEHGGLWESPSDKFRFALAEAGEGRPNPAREWTQELVDILSEEHREWRTATPSDIHLDPITDVITRP